MLKGILKDQELTSTHEIEEVMTKSWNDLTFDDVQNIYRNWMNSLAWVIENREEHVHE
jgi:hypothetical protein